MSSTAVRVASVVVPTRRGDVPARVYRPEGDALAGLVWAHGGGFLGGDLDMPEADWVARSLAGRGVVVVTVGYGLAPVPVGYSFRPIPPRPGVHYPVASEQLTDAFRWVVESGVGEPAIGWLLGGASAGGNLAAGAALRLRDEGGAQPEALLLVYSVLHYLIPAAREELAVKLAAAQAGRPAPPHGPTYLQDNYLGDASPESPYAYASGKDLLDYPPTLVLNADVDDLRPSGEAFAAELAAAGIDVLQLREDGAAHGYLNEPDLPAAAASIGRMAAWITTPSLRRSGTVSS